MLTLAALQTFLKDNNCDFEIIAHETPIKSTQDAEKYFDLEKAAPSLVLDTEQGLLALIVSARRGRMDFKALGQTWGYSHMKLADKSKVQELTGYQAGAVPLLGHQMPCIFDKSLLGYDYIYGGSGDACITLKVAPTDAARLNKVIHFID